MEKNISVGLDIGTTKIEAMVGSRNEFKKLKIIVLDLLTLIV